MSDRTRMSAAPNGGDGVTSVASTVCLNMIVRDAAHVIEETLDSVAAHIDALVIVDTGSTDGTVELTRGWMEEHGVRGEIHERPWRDFGHNRSEALQLAQGWADYIWVIDADDLVIGDLDLSGLSADSYLLRFGNEFLFWRKQIFRDGLRWRYEGLVHEYPVCLDPATEERLEGDYHIRFRRLGARSRGTDTFARDATVLREALERDPDDARSAFYLAQSYYDSGDHRRALEWYTRRAAMGGFDEEIFYSLLRTGTCLSLSGEHKLARAAYLKAWHHRPSRAEPLYEIARQHRLAREFEHGYLFAKRATRIRFPADDSLFVAADVYAWRAADELAICSYYVGQHEESFERWTALLKEPSLPEAERARIETNRALCVPAIAEGRCTYEAELIKRVRSNVGKAALEPEVTVTITSCRRPELFDRTINSFLSCCTDVDRVGRWICVDNGSSDADRRRMRELYPFFEFQYTEPTDERHADSMNRLREAVTGRYWLHLGDDWQFFWRGPYVENALTILRDDPQIAQVAFNRNYGETLECRRIVGGDARTTAGGTLRYRVHEQIEPGTPEWDRYLESLPAGAVTAAHWPHFTLRPSLMRTDAIKALGPFDTAPGHFELQFARRYQAAGLETAFFDAINCLHTGRLTSGGSEQGRVSAYELVGDGGHRARPHQVEVPSVVDESLAIRVINLDRRPDRWASFALAIREAAGAEFADRCQRVEAIDGRTLVETPEMRELFRGNDFRLRRGMVGCALSHISIWRALAARAEHELALVFEDDAQPAGGFDRKLATVVRELRDRHSEFDIALLGYFPTGIEPEPRGADATELRPMRWERYIGGTFAYLLSGRGARKLVELVERDGVQNAIDWFLMYKQAELRVLECNPPLVASPLALASNDIDSDIQHDFVPVASTRAGNPSRRQLRVRLLWNWCSSRELCQLFNRMTTEGDYEWRFEGLDGQEYGLRITSSDEPEPDYWVVINAPPAGEQEQLDRDRTVVFQMEPMMSSEAIRPGWGTWAAPSPLAFLQVRDQRRYRNSGDWHVGLSYAELKDGPPPAKDRTLAACVSAKYSAPGHVRRIDFLRFLDQQEIDLDIYGAPDNGFRRWRSRPPSHDKRLALLPYRYYFDAESNSVPNYFTEKVVDCLLAETLCFYWGCPNLDAFIDPRAFIRLELEDFEADLARIREAIAGDEWSKRLPYIREEKRRILDEYQFFPTLARVIDPGRRTRRWHVSAVDRALVDNLIGERRCGTFVEVSDRVGAPEVSETLDVERRLDWTGLCLEADAGRASRGRAVRDCTVVDDRSDVTVESLMARNGLSPAAIEWLNLAVREPDELIRAGGRLDLKQVRANIISMPTAGEAERRRATARLEGYGYHAPSGLGDSTAPIVMVRAASADIYGFYHLCTINTWREVLDEQLLRWTDSGLAGATERIFASVVGPSADQGVEELAAVCGERLEVVHRSDDPSCSEHLVLQYLRDFCERGEPLARACWYMHAKGVEPENARNPNVIDWRRMMEHVVIDGWRDCVAALDDHDACGPNWQLEPAPHFSGNFWWATPSYLRSLPSRIGRVPVDAERWIGINQPRVLCPHQSGINHYLEPYPPERYLAAV
jgi:GR25 family glycosyltransferase involved in LPS biosynthesis/glycosyltransferase involved in cell wall biosynthesis/GT2 family glycosyltransferase